MAGRTDDSFATYRRLLGYVRPYGKVFALAVLGMMLAAATEPLFPALIKPLLDGGFASGRAKLSAGGTSPARSSASSSCAAFSRSPLRTACTG